MLKIAAVMTTLVVLTMGISARAEMAELQVIHNAADPAAAEVDVYVNDAPFLDDFAFRTATPFVEVPAGVTLNIGIAPGSSGSADDVIAEFPVVLEAGNRYVVMANGVLDPASFALNPGGASIGFNLYPADQIRTSSYFGFVKLKAFHGATDAPAVDIRVQSDWGSWSLFSNLSYGEFSDYRALYGMSYVLDVTPAGDAETVVASYTADLTALRNGAAIVFASGFLNPLDNQDGPAFGLYAALPDGQVLMLPAAEATAQLQVIHNAADPAAAEVDVYLNGELLLDDFAFRTATPFVEVPAGVTLNIGVAPGSSSSADDVIAEFPVVLDSGERYVAMANGVLDPGGFAANPDGHSIAFDLFAKDGIKDRAYFGWVKLIAFHGATDAPTVDIRKRSYWGSRVLFGDLSYGEFSNYRSLRARTYILDVTPAGDEGTVVASYVADLSSLRNGAAVVFASGFLSPLDNQDGPAFGLYVALGDGTVLPLAVADDKGAQYAYNKAEDLESTDVKFDLGQNYPNPFNPTTTISFSLPRASFVSVKVFNVRGQVVKNLLQEPRGAGRHEITLDGRDMASGMYFYRIDADGLTATKSMMLVK